MLAHLSSPNTRGFDYRRLSERQANAHNPFKRPSCEQLNIYCFLCEIAGRLGELTESRKKVASLKLMRIATSRCLMWARIED